jgi:hypothetical protein
MNYFRVENMKSPRTGKAVANQFKIYTDDGIYFQSYGTIIAFKSYDDEKKTTLNEMYWDFSRTTGKYRNEFLGESIQETRKKIETGEYRLEKM